MKNQFKIRVVNVIYIDKFGTEHNLCGPVSESFAKSALSRLSRYWRVPKTELRIIDSTSVR